MAEPYVGSLANSYVQTQDQKGDYTGQNFNGGVSGVIRGDGGVTVGPPQYGGASTVHGQISQNVLSATTGEDPMFTAMAGDSKEFVGGIPKEKWDAMSPEARSEWNTLPPSYQKKARAMGSGLGALVGGTLGTVVGGPGLGLVGGGAASSLGYDIVDDIVKDTTPPNPVTREYLHGQYEQAKNTE